jgi:hypothetical protein
MDEKAAESAEIETPAGWLRANGVDLQALTGTDHRVLRAVAAAWEAYAYGRQSQFLTAIVQMLHVMQPQCRRATKKLIARAMDWSDVDKLWPGIEHSVDAIEHALSARRHPDLPAIKQCPDHPDAPMWPVQGCDLCGFGRDFNAPLRLGKSDHARFRGPICSKCGYRLIIGEGLDPKEVLQFHESRCDLTPKPKERGPQLPPEPLERDSGKRRPS